MVRTRPLQASRLLHWLPGVRAAAELGRACIARDMRRLSLACAAGDKLAALWESCGVTPSDGRDEVACQVGAPQAEQPLS